MIMDRNVLSFIIHLFRIGSTSVLSPQLKTVHNALCSLDSDYTYTLASRR